MSSFPGALKELLLSQTEHTDENFTEVAQLLRNSDWPELSNAARICVISYLSDCLSHLRFFVDLGLSDSSLPISSGQLSARFSEEQQTAWKAAQTLICNGSDLVQMMNLGQHVSFSRTPTNFILLRHISNRAHSRVDEVYCTFKKQCFARKTFTPVDNEAVMSNIRQDIEAMKPLICRHRHIVQLVSPYAL
jgi:hypothetical protein